MHDDDGPQFIPEEVKMRPAPSTFSLASAGLVLLIAVTFGAGNAGAQAAETGSLCSARTDRAAPLEVEFINDSSESISFHWLDFDCVEGSGPVLAPGQRKKGMSHSGHVFRVRGQAEQTLKHVVVADDTRRFVVDDALIERVAAEGEPYTEGTCSPKSRQKLTVEFVNLLNEPIAMQWIGFDCKVHALRRIPAHGRTKEKSFVGHVFRFVDSNGAQLRSLDIAADEVIYHVSEH